MHSGNWSEYFKYTILVVSSYLFVIFDYPFIADKKELTTVIWELSLRKLAIKILSAHIGRNNFNNLLESINNSRKNIIPTLITVLIKRNGMTKDYWS